MRTVLGALPKGLLERTHAFCLRCVAESLDSIRALCPISAGFAAPGKDCPLGRTVRRTFQGAGQTGPIGVQTFQENANVSVILLKILIFSDF